MNLDANPAESSAADELENEAAASAAAEGTDTDANPTGSSAVDEGEQPKDLLSVVKSAVQKPEGEAESPAAEGGKETDAEGAEAEAGKAGAEGESEAEADAKLPFHEHPRWKEVIAERDSYKDDAGRFREIEGFMQTHGLTPDEVAEGYDVMAQLKSGDPENLAKVRDYFSSRLDWLNQQLGHVLPEDLRERVDNGEIDEDAAQELAQARAKGKLIEDRDTAARERDEWHRGQREVVARAQAMATAADEWEKRQKASDPDYPKKAALVETAARAIMHRTGKIPQTPEEAVALSEAALKEVNDAFKPLVAQRRPIRRDPQGSSTPTVSQPKTLKEAIRGAVSG